MRLWCFVFDSHSVKSFGLGLPLPPSPRYLWLRVNMEGGLMLEHWVEETAHVSLFTGLGLEHGKGDGRGARVNSEIDCVSCLHTQTSLDHQKL